MVPFKELGLGLSEEQISEEEAHNFTDGFSLPALKVIHLCKGRAEEKNRCTWIVSMLSECKWCVCYTHCLLHTIIINARVMFVTLSLRAESIIKIGRGDP